jgi:hypothetical protein
MARKLSVTAPNGKTYDIEAPDNATDDEIHAEVLRVHPEAAGMDASGDPSSDIIASMAAPDSGGTSVGPDGKMVVDIVGGHLPSPGEEGYDAYIKAGYQTDPQGNIVPKEPDQRPVSQSQGFSEGFEKPANNAADWVTTGLNKTIPSARDIATGNLDLSMLADPSALIKGALGGLSYAGAALEGNGNLQAGDAINKFGAETLGMAPSIQAARDTQQQARDRSPYQSGGLGKFAGELTGAVLLSRLPGGAFSQGAQGGALLTDTPNDALGVAKDAAIGGTVGKAGAAVLGAAGRAAAPAINDGLRTLLDAGIRVTPGQAARAGGGFGRVIGGVEDKAMSRPFVGGMITNARNQSLDDFARATINRSVEPIGAKLPDSISLETTAGARSAVRWAGDKLSDAFEQIKPRIRVQANDPAFLDDLTTVRNDLVSDMHPARIKQYDNILKGLGRFWQDGTELSGQAYKDVESRLTRNINQFARGDGDQQQLSRALESVRDALTDLAERQNPDVAATLKSLNTGWKSLTQVERAAGTSKGLPTPAGYSQAVKMSSDTVRRRGYSRGTALNQDLSDAASDILPSSIADSGTAGRIGGIRAGAVGLAQALPYLAAQKVTPLLLRQNGASPALAKLLEYGARSVPYVAPPLISQYR